MISNTLNIESGVEEEKQSGRTHKQWLVAVLVATALLNYGMQMGWTSPMKKVLQSPSTPSGTPLTDTEISLVASLMPLSAVLTTAQYAYIADTFGRKIGVIAIFLPQALCWIIKLSSKSTVAIIVARIFAGIPAGGCFNIIPMYIKEISQDNIRGKLVAMSMTFPNIGYLSMYAMGGYLNYHVILWIAMCIPVVSFILLLVTAPESPSFLVKKGKFEEAAKTVAKLRCLDVDHRTVQSELEYMKKQEEYFRTVKNITFLSIFKNKAWLRGLLITGYIMMSVNINGTLSITSYAWTIMMEAGVSLNPELQTLSIPAIMIAGALVSTVCVEKFGRKPIIIGGFTGATVSHVCLATTLYLQRLGDVTVPVWVPVLAIVGCVLSYAGGVLPMTYVILAEIFPFQVRAKLISLIVTYGWSVTFIQLFSFYPISSTFGIYTTFYMFAGVNFLGATVCLIFLPETMGKSVEEIEQTLLRNKAK